MQQQKREEEAEAEEARCFLFPPPFLFRVLSTLQQRKKDIRRGGRQEESFFKAQSKDRQKSKFNVVERSLDVSARVRTAPVILHIPNPLLLLFLSTMSSSDPPRLPPSPSFQAVMTKALQGGTSGAMAMSIQVRHAFSQTILC